MEKRKEIGGTFAAENTIKDLRRENKVLNARLGTFSTRLSSILQENDFVKENIDNTGKEISLKQEAFENVSNRLCLILR